jgi:hypothetical protein
MKTTTPKDKRNGVWQLMEKNIQSNALRKDKSFSLSGKWKKLVRKQNGYKIYRVDGSWVRHNLSFYFGHGGHGFVHEFIPVDEIWVSSHHPYEGRGSVINCTCRLHKKGQKMSDNYFNSTVLHEITECNNMKKGKVFWVAHNIALETERKAGLIEDPYGDL